MNGPSPVLIPHANQQPTNVTGALCKGGALATVARAVRRLVAAVMHRSALSRLADFDDRLLADIGLARSDLRAASSEPLWRDPTATLTRRAARRRTRAIRIPPSN
jgi:uncharacterized protein YjiS (DUF1127 family)